MVRARLPPAARGRRFRIAPRARFPQFVYRPPPNATLSYTP
jgi:hypothetical protein